MGIIDSVAISSMAATGVLEFNNGPTLWFLTVGLLCAAAGAIALSGLPVAGLARLRLPPLAHAPLVPTAVSRAK